MTRIVVVTSGKGGVGRTFLAVGIAQALAQAGRSVLLFDADLSAACLAAFDSRRVSASTAWRPAVLRR